MCVSYSVSVSVCLRLSLKVLCIQEVSTPGSASYGKHLTWDQVGSLVSNPHSLAAVQAWISTGAPAAECNATPHHEYLSCTAPISSWNHLLSAQFREYSRGGMVVHRATTVSVPEEMEQHLAGVFLAVDLPVSMEVSTYGALSRYSLLPVCLCGATTCLFASSLPLSHYLCLAVPGCLTADVCVSLPLPHYLCLAVPG